MRTTGDKNKKMAIYQAVCCGHQIAIAPGARFPACPEHKQVTVWKELREFADKKKRDGKAA